MVVVFPPGVMRQIGLKRLAGKRVIDNSRLPPLAPTSHPKVVVFFSSISVWVGGFFFFFCVMFHLTCFLLMRAQHVHRPSQTDVRDAAAEIMNPPLLASFPPCYQVSSVVRALSDNIPPPPTSPSSEE